MDKEKRIQLCEPFLDKGIQNTNFFNGRLLAAEDLEAQQAAERLHQGQLGRSVGSGVVSGLEVTVVGTGAGGGLNAALRITAGLALEPSGQPLELPTTILVDLAPQQVASKTNGGTFDCCITLPPPTIAIGLGFYLLVVAPAAGFDAYAPLSGLNGDGKITGCGRKYKVDGVQFRAIKVDLAAMLGLADPAVAEIGALMTKTRVAGATPTDLADLSLLRNRIAHLALGTARLAPLPTDPFDVLGDQSVYASYGLTDYLAAQGSLDVDEVPLALLYWTASGLRFVDMWSVRRRPGAPFTGDPWSAFLSPRRAIEAEATFLQFAQHLAWLRESAANLGTVRATDCFRYLPAGGLLPLARGRHSTQGLNAVRFFDRLKVRNPTSDPVYIEGAVAAAVLRETLNYPPIDLRNADQSAGQAQQELIWLYRVRENQQAVETGAAAGPGAYLLFTNGHVPYRGDARLDLNYWNYANFA